jgi:transcriptional regulator with XRE-family HTH domain
MKKEDIAKLFNISRQTLGNWEKDKPELYKIIEHHFEDKKDNVNLNNEDNLNNEIINTLNKLPIKAKKKFYYLMMAELTEQED